jgi:hypothetical protein
MYWSIKYQNYILNVIMGLDINIETKHDSNYNFILFFLHENIDYIQMYNFVFNHDDKI